LRQPTVIANGGYRRDCPNCGGQHFPRTDPVVIMLAIHDGIDGERALLGRQPRFAPGMYSCLAGFIEPGETIEGRRPPRDARGIRRPHRPRRYHASQPWPFPSSLMIGCHAEALTDRHRGDETELEDCRWFSRDEVRAMLAGAHPAGDRPEGAAADGDRQPAGTGPPVKPESGLGRTRDTPALAAPAFKPPKRYFGTTRKCTGGRSADHCCR
jgi:NADH pyrophosphatase NudC (nudix superfamily)